MNRDFEVNSEYRAMDNAELVNILTNNPSQTNRLKEEEAAYGENCDLESILNRMTPAKRKVAMAGIELYKRYSAQKNMRPQIKCSSDIFNIMRPIIGDNRTEEAWVVLLNHANRVIRKTRVSAGGIAATIIDVRVVLKEALMCDASYLILCHNHPSGNHKPSKEDDMMTWRLKEAANAVNIQMLDHLVVCSDSYFSYADGGKL